MTKRITITPATGTWVVRAGGAVLGETQNALELDETGHAPVIYFPRADIGMAFLEQTTQTSVCPFKGTARYFSIMSKSVTYENAAWSYEAPNAEAAAIAGHIAFLAQDGVTVEQV